jgi:hypothetical protein
MATNGETAATLQQTVEEQGERLRAQQARLDAQAAELTELRALVHQLRQATTTASAVDPTPVEEPATNRRQLLKLAGAAAVGAVAAGAAGLGAQQAAAADNGALLIGATNLPTAGSTNPTLLNFAGSGNLIGTFTPAFAVSDSGSASTTFPAAVAGMATAKVNYGVTGYSTRSSGYGVAAIGQSSAGGAYIHSDAAVGAVVESGSTVALVVGGTGRLGLEANPSVFSGPPLVGTYSQGELLRDGAGNLWYCIAAGSPGSWRKVAGPPAAGAFHVVSPTRVYDSRLPGPTPGKIAWGQTRTLSIANGIDIVTGLINQPNLVQPGSQAITYNLTITDTEGSGYLTLFPASDSSYFGSSINWSSAGQILANAAVVKISPNREIKVAALGLITAKTHFVIDLTGYYL